MLTERLSCISPLDFRYYGGNERLFQKIQPYFSEEAFIRYQARVESVVSVVLMVHEVCSPEASAAIRKACREIDPYQVYAEEGRIKHNIRALRNVICQDLPDDAKRWVHWLLTSADVLDTANALRFREATDNVVLPMLCELEEILIGNARCFADTLQIGRTHGQHALPITFGFALSEYVSRLGNRILAVNQAKDNLRGKISGAVGAYNSMTLFENVLGDPEKFEQEVLSELGLKPSTHSTQIVEPEFMADYMHSIVSCFGVLANLADDLRNLQRSEILEVGEVFEADQVGSSTMPHKVNPIGPENFKSQWKEFMPRMITVYLDQISDHQRDLTNSASGRYLPEMVVGLLVAVDQITRVMKKITVNQEAMQRNFDMNKHSVIAEPLYLLLAFYGHPEAHEAVRVLTIKAKQSGTSLLHELIMVAPHDTEIGPRVKKFTPEQWEVLKDPDKYIGIASRKTEEVCDYWEAEIEKLKGEIENA